MSENSKKCDCCGNDVSKSFSARPLDYCLDKDFDVYTCLTCGHGKTEGIAEGDLALVYEDGAYDPKENRWHKLLRPALNILEISKLSYLHSDDQKDKNLLEIGTGKGNFLNQAIRSGYNAAGIEPSSRSYQEAKTKLGERVVKCTLEEMHQHALLNRKYNYIFLWHVFEHLDDPEKATQILKSFLDPNGLLIIAVPNFDSYQSKLGKKDWYHLDPPRHLCHFTPRSIKLLLERNGITIKRIYFNSFFQNILGEIITINNSILPHKNILLNLLRFNKYYFAKTDFVTKILNFLSFVIISSITFVPVVFWTFLSQLLKKSGTMVIVAKCSIKN